MRQGHELTDRHTHHGLRTVAGLLGGVLAEVAERGSELMPFDLDATTHRFASTETGRRSL
jgi:hypothetical protein